MVEREEKKEKGQIKRDGEIRGREKREGERWKEKREKLQRKRGEEEIGREKIEERREDRKE